MQVSINKIQTHKIYGKEKRNDYKASAVSFTAKPLKQVYKSNTLLSLGSITGILTGFLAKIFGYTLNPERILKSAFCRKYGINPKSREYKYSVPYIYEKISDNSFREIYDYKESSETTEKLALNTFQAIKGFPDFVKDEIIKTAKELKEEKFIHVPHHNYEKPTVASRKEIKEALLNKYGLRLHVCYDDMLGNTITGVSYSHKGKFYPVDYKHVGYEQFLDLKIRELIVNNHP